MRFSRTTKFIVLLTAALLVDGFLTKPLAQEGPSMVVQRARSDRFSSAADIALSPDQKLVVTINGKTAILWNSELGLQLRSFFGHPGDVKVVRFSPDGRSLLSGSVSRDVGYPPELAAAEKEYFESFAAGWSDEANARREAVGQKVERLRQAYEQQQIVEAHNLKLWDLSTGKEIREYQGLTGPIAAAVFNRDGSKIMASHSYGGTEYGVAVWATGSGKLLTRFPLQDIVALSFDMAGEGVVLYGKSGILAKSKIAASASPDTKKLPDKSEVAAFSSDARQLAIGRRNGEIACYDVASGRLERSFVAHEGEVARLRFANDGKRLFSVSNAGEVKVWDTRRGTLIATPIAASAGPFVLSRDERKIIVTPFDNTDGTESHAPVEIWDVGEGKRVASFHSASSLGTNSLVRTDGRKMLLAGVVSTEFWDFASGQAFGREVVFLPRMLSNFYALPATVIDRASFPYFAVQGTQLYRIDPSQAQKVEPFAQLEEEIRSVALSPDEEFVATATETTLTIWETQSGKEVQRLPSPGGLISLVFSPDAKSLACFWLRFSITGEDDVALYDLASGQKKWSVRLHSSRIEPETASFSPDGEQLAMGGVDGKIKIVSVASGKVLRTLDRHSAAVSALAYFPDGEYLVSASADDSTILWDMKKGDWLARLYMFQDGTWAVVAPDGRFDTNNLEEIEGLHWVLPDAPFTPLPLEIFMRDYYEPRLLSKLLGGAMLPPLPDISTLNRLQPKVEITAVIPSPGLPDAVDVTLAVTGRSEATRRSGAFDLRLSRDGQLVGWQDGPLPLDAKGKATLTFRGIALPQREEGGKAEFSAYTFNNDRVKSATARYSYALPLVEQPRPRRAYLVNIGVNAYDNPRWDLRFAANDAQSTRQALEKRLQRQGDFTEVVAVELVSADVPVRRNATRAHLQAVLQRLAGDTGAVDLLAAIPGAEKLRKATPDDLLIISFSGHGYADERGGFYLLTSDIGAMPSAEITPALLALGVSSGELSDWLRPVDAGEIALIIDACHSAASVEGEGFKPGPMGSRGLGQLAYDKGMKILAASQSADVALENAQLQQGLLTYALVQNGLEGKRADFKPQDHEIRLGEWLAYAVERVPKLHEEMKSGKVDAETGAPRSVIRFAPPGKGERRELQQPSLFDFRRRGEDVLLVPTQ